MKKDRTAATSTAPAVSQIHRGIPPLVLASAVIESVVASGESVAVAVEVIVTGGPTAGVMKPSRTYRKPESGSEKRMTNA